MKRIIERHLPLNVKYTVTDKKYIPLLDGYGQTCDNCGQLIANIATVKSCNGVYNIGFDCMETMLLNNQLLEGFTLADLAETKAQINKAISAGKKLKETISQNKGLNITGLTFERKTYESDYYPFHYDVNGAKTRSNDYMKIKGANFPFILQTLQNIFPKLTFKIES